MSQHPPTESYKPHRAQISVTWLLREGPQSYQDTSPGHSRESFAESCDLGLNETGAGDSGLFTDTASCWKWLTFKGSRHTKCSLTLYFNSLLSLARQTAFKFWLPISQICKVSTKPSQHSVPGVIDANAHHYKRNIETWKTATILITDKWPSPLECGNPGHVTIRNKSLTFVQNLQTRSFEHVTASRCK